MDGLRNESKATGRGRIVVARAEVVMVNDGTEKRCECVSHGNNGKSESVASCELRW